MLVEKKLNDALIDYTKGRKVVVLQCAQDGRIDANLLSDFLEDDQVKYLVDVPAYSNPDFEDAIRDMAESAKVPEDHPDLESESEEQLPPPRRAGGR